MRSTVAFCPAAVVARPRAQRMKVEENGGLLELVDGGRMDAPGHRDQLPDRCDVDHVAGQ
jgi:hypothetical protein